QEFDSASGDPHQALVDAVRTGGAEALAALLGDQTFVLQELALRPREPFTPGDAPGASFTAVVARIQGLRSARDAPGARASPPRAPPQLATPARPRPPPSFGPLPPAPPAAAAPHPGRRLPDLAAAGSETWHAATAAATAAAAPYGQERRHRPAMQERHVTVRR